MTARLLLLAALAAACRPGAPESPGFVVIGHRGAAGHAPENTIAAIEAAWALGVRDVELDVQLSADGVPVLFHDATLDAKTDLAGRVREHPARALARADIGSWFDAAHPKAEKRFAGTTLATLEAALARFGPRLRYHLEIKTPEPELPRRLLAVVRDARLQGRVSVTSFQLAQLERVRALDASIPLHRLVDRGASLALAAGAPEAEIPALQREAIDEAARRGLRGVGLRAAEIDAKLVAHARSRGLAVRAWEVRDHADLDRVLALGLDAATLDRPEWGLAGPRVAPPATGK